MSYRIRIDLATHNVGIPTEADRYFNGAATTAGVHTFNVAFDSYAADLSAAYVLFDLDPETATDDVATLTAALDLGADDLAEVTPNGATE